MKHSSNQNNSIMSVPRSISQKGCPYGYGRDRWFRILPDEQGDVDESECTVHIVTFTILCGLLIVGYVAILFSAIVGIARNKRPNARKQLALLIPHCVGGSGLLLATMLRDDFHIVDGHLGFYSCWGLWIIGFWVAILYSSESVRNLAGNIIPVNVLENKSFGEMVLADARLQQIAIFVASIQVPVILIALILVPSVNGPVYGVYWDHDPQWYARTEFWWMVFWIFNSFAIGSFIVVPVRHHYRIWRFMKETRKNLENNVGMPRLSTASATPLTAKQYDLSPISPLHPPDSPSKLRLQSFKKRLSSLASITANAAAPNTNMSNGRKQVLNFENKMLQGVVIGILGAFSTYILNLLMCDNRLIGPRWYLIIYFFALAFAYDGLILNLYMPPTLCFCVTEDQTQVTCCEKWILGMGIVTQHSSGEHVSKRNLLGNKQLQQQPLPIKEETELPTMTSIVHEQKNYIMAPLPLPPPITLDNNNNNNNTKGESPPLEVSMSFIMNGAHSQQQQQQQEEEQATAIAIAIEQQKQ